MVMSKEHREMMREYLKDLIEKARNEHEKEVFTETLRILEAKWKAEDEKTTQEEEDRPFYSNREVLEPNRKFPSDNEVLEPNRKHPGL